MRAWLEARPESERAVCRYRTILLFELDLPETNRAGALCRFTSTGIHTAMYLRSSLMQITAMTHWLATLPLYLVLEKTPLKPTPGGLQRLPYVRFESRVPTGELQAQAEEVSRKLLGNQGRLLQLQAASSRILEAEVARDYDPGYAAEFAAAISSPEEASLPAEPEVLEGVFETAEAAAGAEAEPPAVPAADPDTVLTEGQYRRQILQYGKEAGWSDVVLKAKLQRASEGGPEAYASLLKEARRAALGGEE